MADNYLLFSEIVPDLSEDERAWATRVLGCTQQPDRAADAPKLLRDAGVDVEAVDLEDWPEFQWELAPSDSELWLYDDACGNVGHVGEFVRAFLARFRPDQCWSLTWAETCSSPRVGEFGGGGLFVTASRVQFCVPHDWLRRQKEKFERAGRWGDASTRRSASRRGAHARRRPRCNVATTLTATGVMARPPALDSPS